MGGYGIEDLTVAEIKSVEPDSAQKNLARLEVEREVLARQALACIDDTELWNKIWARFESLTLRIDMIVRYNMF